MLLAHNFLGNVRELENDMERTAALARFVQVVPDDLSETLKRSMPLSEGHDEELLTLHEMEQRYVAHVMQLVSGNKSRAAHLLQVDRRTIERKPSVQRRASVRAATNQTELSFTTAATRAGEDKTHLTHRDVRGADPEMGSSLVRHPDTLAFMHRHSEQS